MPNVTESFDERVLPKKSGSICPFTEGIFHQSGDKDTLIADSPSLGVNLKTFPHSPSAAVFATF